MMRPERMIGRGAACSLATATGHGNNPLHVRRGWGLWQGLAPEQEDPEFLHFCSPAWGYRAAFVLLRIASGQGVLTTVDEVVAHWAPAADREELAIFRRMVEVLTGLPADRELDAENPDVMVPLVAAMSRIENGQPPTMREVCSGWRLYLAGG